MVWNTRRSRSERYGVGLEVLGEDQIVIERLDEAIDLLLHVGVHQSLEIAHERLGAAIELLVEALDELLLEDAAAAPLAVGAAQADLPVHRARLVPLRGVDEVGLAGRADVQVLNRLVDRDRPTRPRLGVDQLLIVEVDDLDGLAGGEDHAADVVAVVGLRAHQTAPVGPTSTMRPQDLTPSSGYFFTVVRACSP